MIKTIKICVFNRNYLPFEGIKWLFAFFVGFQLIFFPVSVQAEELQSSLIETELGERVEASKQMTQEEINSLLGEDPYLGQTSYLQSPKGFSLNEK